MEDNNSNSLEFEKIKRFLQAAEQSLAAAKKALSEVTGEDMAATSLKPELPGDLTVTEGGKIIEGIFDGENMVGPDSKVYPVPANYASKSRLVAGDRLKLTVADDGSFIFKQIGPAERKKLIGALGFQDNAYHVLAEGKSYNVLHASVTYYKANVGDKVTIVVPENQETNWAAIENIIHDVKDLESLQSEVAEVGIMEETTNTANIFDETPPVEISEFPKVDEPTPSNMNPSDPKDIFSDDKELVPLDSVSAESVAAPEITTIKEELPQEQIAAEIPIIKSEPIAPEASQPENGLQPNSSVPENDLPEESFLPRTQDDEANSLGEKTTSAWDNTNPQPATELDI